MQYTQKVMNIVKESLSKVEQITGELQELTARYRAEEISGQDYRAQKAELDQRISAVRVDAMKVLQDTGAAYRAHVERAAEIDGSMLHEDAKLLQLDMKCLHISLRHWSRNTRAIPLWRSCCRSITTMQFPWVRSS